jgi:acetolactate synthase regulatory subunit
VVVVVLMMLLQLQLLVMARARLLFRVLRLCRAAQFRVRASALTRA